MILYKQLSRTDLLYLAFLFSLIALYALHLFSFTLFEGFTTFSNDAGPYVLLAQKWSPFFVQSEAVANSWPVQIYPPGFSWVLSISGMSKSLWSSHLLVAVFMLMSVFLFGWTAYRRFGWLTGSLLTLGLCLLPGIVISSMGILSENLYLLLSLTALIIYDHIRNDIQSSWGSYLLLFFCLAMLILTRTIGVALIAAMFFVPLLDKSLTRQQKIRLIAVAVFSLAPWLLWSVLNPQPSELTYGFRMQHYANANETVAGVLHNLNVNFVQILSSWSHYLTLTKPGILFFLYSYGLFLLCIIGLGLRLLQRKLDAVYLMFYLAILLVWPFPDQMMRFLHPVMFLLILQGASIFARTSKDEIRNVVNPGLAVISLIIITSSIFIQVQLVMQRNTLRVLDPSLVHSVEVYDSPSKEQGMMLSSVFVATMKYMISSSEHIPVKAIVATAKPETYAILANRRAVNLVDIVPYPQQLCNLIAMDVEVVFLSNLTTMFHTQGHKLLETYKDISSHVWSVKAQTGSGQGHTLIIDKAKLNLELSKTGYNCQSYRAY